jgi:hypothetical protein
MSDASFNKEDFDRIFGVSIKDIKEDYPMIRNAVLEEVAREIEKMTVFGKDTIDSFVVFIRDMKT